MRWHIGTRFRGALEVKPERVCMVNWIEGGELGYIVVPVTQLYPHTFDKPPIPNSIKFCDNCVKQGSWIIISQPFSHYYKQIKP